MKASPAVRALEDAVLQLGDPEGMIVHSDRGNQGEFQSVVVSLPSSFPVSARRKVSVHTDTAFAARSTSRIVDAQLRGNWSDRKITAAWDHYGVGMVDLRRSSTELAELAATRRRLQDESDTVLPPTSPTPSISTR